MTRDSTKDDCQVANLHEWFYQIASDICYDREYVYMFFVEHFSRFMHGIFEQGRFSESGTYVIPGLKNDLRAMLHWQLEHRVNCVGSNVLAIQWTMESISQKVVAAESRHTFELTTGELIG